MVSHRAISLGAAVLILASCDTSPTDTGSSPAGNQLAVPTSGTVAAERPSHFPATPRVNISLSATGPFRPGVPIEVTARATGRFRAQALDYHLILTDDDPTITPNAATSSRPLQNWRGGLAAGAQATLHSTVVFPRPGYYRVTAAARNARAPTDAWTVRDSVILDEIQQHLWILVDENGGRLTAGYDTTAIPRGVVPLYGSYGPFKPRRRNPMQRGTGATASATASLLSGATISGYFRYLNYDLPGTPPPLAGVPGAEIQAFCHGKSDPLLDDYDLEYFVSTLTSIDGSFGVACDPGYEYITGSILLRNSYVHAFGPEGAPAGADFYGYDGEHFELRAANDYSARVFIDLRAHVPVIFSKFGRTKGRVIAYVSANDYSYGINWCTTGFTGCPGVDVIRSNLQRVFSGGSIPYDGLFVTVHEYSHGYQYYAVEPWETGSGVCSGDPPSHGWTETENRGCAMVEAFADWIAMTAIGPTVAYTPYGGDYGLENNRDWYPGNPTNPPAGGDGVRVESAVAAFLYDLIDNGSEFDSPSNAAGPAETHDNLAVMPSAILDIMNYCRLNGTPLNLSGADQLVYCLEGSAAAYAVATTYSSAWRSYSSVSYEQSVPSISQAEVRKLWKVNMYGVP